MAIFSVITGVIKSTSKDVITTNSRKLYLFDSSNSDHLSLDEYFTGRITLFIVGESASGINPILLNGLQHPWESSDNILKKPNFNLLEIDVVDLINIVDDTFTGVLIYALNGIWYDMRIGYGNHPEIKNELSTSWTTGTRFPNFRISYTWKVGDDFMHMDQNQVVSKGI